MSHPPSALHAPTFARCPSWWRAFSRLGTPFLLGVRRDLPADLCDAVRMLAEDVVYLTPQAAGYRRRPADPASDGSVGYLEFICQIGLPALAVKRFARLTKQSDLCFCPGHVVDL